MAAGTAARSQGARLREVQQAAVLAAPGFKDEYAQLRRTEMRARLTGAGVPLIERTDLPEVTDRDILSDLAFEIEQYLRGLTVQQLVCLAYGHKWPELIPGLKIPGGFRTVMSPERNGVFLITENCVRKTLGNTCGTTRKSMTLPGTVRGIFDRDHGRSYDYGRDWEIRPASSRLSRIDFLNEIFRRMARELFEDVIAAAEAGEVVSS
jgi:hypothetical protein